MSMSLEPSRQAKRHVAILLAATVVFACDSFRIAVPLCRRRKTRVLVIDLTSCQLIESIKSNFLALVLISWSST